MHALVHIIGNGLVLAGALILASALIPVLRLFQQIPTGTIRARWRTLTVLIIFFLFGYVVYAVLAWNVYGGVLGLVAPAVFFCGAIFVLLVCFLSLNTTREIIQMYTIQRESITDPLTGIYNRRYLDHRLEEEVSRSQRYNLPFSMLMLDIDHFKRVNDTHGHQAGDLILKTFSRIILDTLRESDIVARYGGEEFLIILPNTGEPGALAMAERLRNMVEEYEFALPENKEENTRSISITVSIGVASYSSEISEYRSLIENADRALYRAKSAGRNKVVVGNGMDTP